MMMTLTNDIGQTWTDNIDINLRKGMSKQEIAEAVKMVLNSFGIIHKIIRVVVH